MSSVATGDLRHRLTLQSLTRASDGAGGFTEGWDDIVTVWAALRPLRGEELVEAGRVTGKVSHIIHLRYRDGVQPTMRFVLGDRLFDIRAVIDPEERRRWLECYCEEREL